MAGAGAKGRTAGHATRPGRQLPARTDGTGVRRAAGPGWALVDPRGGMPGGDGFAGGLEAGVGNDAVHPGGLNPEGDAAQPVGRNRPAGAVASPLVVWQREPRRQAERKQAAS